MPNDDDDVLIRHVVGEAVASEDTGELDRRRDRLRRAIGQLDEATIATIHGFCQSMLQHTALEAGVDLDAELLDDDEDLRAEVVDDLLARELRRADPAWIRYLRDVAAVDRARMIELGRAVAGMPALQLLPDVPALDAAPDLAPWTAALTDFQRVWEAGGRSRMTQLIDELKRDGAFESPRQRTFTVAKAADRVTHIDDWLEQPHPVPPTFARERKDLHLDEHHPYAFVSDTALGTKLSDVTVVSDEPVVAAASALLAAVYAPATRFLLRASNTIWDELDRRKRQRTVLTFDDLLRRLDDALRDPTTRERVRAAIRQRYKVALIDEFQDTDPIQWRIFSAVFDADEPFVLIGDPKQAIYGFRGADIDTYVVARDSRRARATLGHNHRSDGSYVAACNHLFGRPDAFGTDDIPYHPVEARHADRLVDPAARAAMTIRFLQRDAGELGRSGTGKGLLTKGGVDRILPDDVAAVAVETLESGMRLPADDGGLRPVAPQDLAVLVRTNRRARAIQGALRTAGVPAVIQRGGSVFDTPDADAVHRLLTAMLRPSSQPAAVAAAASVLGGRDAATLVAQLTAIDAGTTDGDPTIADAWDDWIDALTRWGERWARHGVLAALQAALRDDDVAPRLLARDDGDRTLTNVRHLMELLHTAERSEGLAPHALLEWLQHRRADAADSSLAAADAELRLEADADAVRVVTVHGSKGLQYPIVLCPDLWDGGERRDAALLRFHDPEAGDGAAAITLDVDADHDSPGKQRSIRLARAEQRREQLRLTYVALTRAEHRSIVWWGAINHAPNSALAHLLHAGWPDGQPTDDDLLADLRAFVAPSNGCLDIEVVDAPSTGARWTPAAPAAPQLSARDFTRGPLDDTWRRTSFSALVRNVGDGGIGGDGTTSVISDDDGRDVDADADDDADASPPVTDPVEDRDAAADLDAPEVPLGRFPRGAAPGTFLHDVLEHLDTDDVDDDERLDALIEHQRQRHGIGDAHHASVRDGLRAALDTGLGPFLGDVRLRDIPTQARAAELRFELPIAGGHRGQRRPLRLQAATDLLRHSADPLIAAYAHHLDAPGFASRVRGYLNGSIDLLARLPDGRFLVADYKSNWFGDPDTGRSTAADYAPPVLATSMLHHHYVLQALLYLVATHRFLRWRVRGYDYDTHVAGAGYLFLRGMVGGVGARTGVVLLRPDGALIHELSQRIDGGAR